ncbi:hypothetical protein CN266_04665 [Bacillus cereus]|uniref:hypothetical protein n=1 Tax=Bacillus cereus TaxID=1396 RepID=UPI000278E68C|nr:hypothetical protein [Bacillus cereus]EJQ19562.1 hypothetical protein IE9_05731 [Bacillus cereus BAG4X12-1]EOP77797.1 hypothetical protein IEG_05585 [Bacillus cereus BAG5X12-1]MEB9368820.1 hypothetical protein [Bacillus cereus]PER69574.1 hypothetical protein CN502_09650 [Bacillus cereus]PES52466.1 hypothetical protein CN515_12415 [Bacillus cereus]
MTYVKLFQFRGNQIHVNIVQDFQRQYPEYPREADVLRHAIVLLDEKMREGKGQDNVSLLEKEVKGLKQSVNTMKQQMDVLIKLNMELIARSGSNLSLEELQQEVKSEIASAVTKKSEGKFSRTVKREPIEENVQEQERIQSHVETPSFVRKTLPMITDDVKIVMKEGKPCKVISKIGRELYQEIEWEQIPEHRRKELE